jgi:hypothetical protein
MLITNNPGDIKPLLTDTLQPVVVLDLDQTLIDGNTLSFSFYDYSLSIDNRIDQAIIKIRPGLKIFIDKLKSTNIRVVIWTASVKRYACKVIEELGLESLNILGVIYNGPMWFNPKAYFKDLNLISDDISRIVLLDDVLTMSIPHPDNTIIVPSFTYGVTGEGTNCVNAMCKVIDCLIKGPMCEWVDNCDFLVKKSDFFEGLCYFTLPSDIPLPSEVTYHYPM